MGFFKSMFRFVSSLFGLAQGQTERMTDAMVSATPDAIRAQFRKTRDDWTKDYHDMRDALSELIRIREARSAEIDKLENDLRAAVDKMAGAITLYKQTPDERFREAYGQNAAKKAELDQRKQDLMTQLDLQNKTIDAYKGRLIDLHKQIEALSKEEAETIADIVSADKLRELNDRLAGLALDTQSKNLQAIREHRQKSNATSKLSTELSGNEEAEIDRKLRTAGTGSKFMSDFDSAISKPAELEEIREAVKTFEQAAK